MSDQYKIITLLIIDWFHVANGVISVADYNYLWERIPPISIIVEIVDSLLQYVFQFFFEY